MNRLGWCTYGFFVGTLVTAIPVGYYRWKPESEWVGILPCARCGNWAIHWGFRVKRSVHILFIFAIPLGTSTRTITCSVCGSQHHAGPGDFAGCAKVAQYFFDLVVFPREWDEGRPTGPGGGGLERVVEYQKHQVREGEPVKAPVVESLEAESWKLADSPWARVKLQP